MKFFFRQSQPAQMLDMAKLIRSLIGRDVPAHSSNLDEEDIALFTTVHQAIVKQYTTQPIETIETRKKG